MAQTLEQLSSLGVDRVKVSLIWWLVAPDPTSTRRPNFNASDPAAYPAGAWDRYDMLVRMAQELGLKVYFEFSPADPAWAVAARRVDQARTDHSVTPRTRSCSSSSSKPVERRYSGNYDAPVPADQPAPADLGIPGGSSSNSGQPAAIPRVNYWGIWNEPNERSWLNPWWRPFPGHKHAIIEAELYRNLFDAAWSGLAATGHNPSRDTILVGETANEGVLTPAGVRPRPVLRRHEFQAVEGRCGNGRGLPELRQRPTVREPEPRPVQGKWLRAAPVRIRRRAEPAIPEPVMHHVREPRELPPAPPASFRPLTASTRGVALRST